MMTNASCQKLELNVNVHHLLLQSLLVSQHHTLLQAMWNAQNSIAKASALCLKKELSAKFVEFLNLMVSPASVRGNYLKRKSSVNQGALKDSVTSQDLTSDALAKPQRLNSKILETLLQQLYLRKSQSVKEKLELGSALGQVLMKNANAQKVL